MKTYTSKSYLFISGFIMMIVGGFIALAPSDYLASMNGMDGGTGFYLSTVPSLNMLSDLRGMGGTLLVLSLYIFLSAFRNSWQPVALLVSTMVYASFFVFRSLGFLLDGFPGIGLMIAYVIEFALAYIGLLLVRVKGCVWQEENN